MKKVIIEKMMPIIEIIIISFVLYAKMYVHSNILIYVQNDYVQ